MKRLLAFPLLTIFVAGAAVWPALPARAASSVAAGWWTSAPVGSPDVPSGGLSVQGGPDATNPVAYSAVSFALDPGEHAQKVTLAVTGSSATTPNAQLMACRLTSTFAPASGGSMSAAPRYDCNAGKATASPSSDGKSYAFDVSGISADGALAIAILPTQPTDRVVFDPPSTSSLESVTTPAASTTADSSPTLDAGTSSASTYSAPPSATGSFDVPSTPAPDVAGPATGSLGASDTPRASNADATRSPAGASTSSSPTSHARVLVPIALGLALVAAVLWFAAGAGSASTAELAEETS